MATSWKRRERIAGRVVRTPLIESEIGGTRVWLKCECLQTGGAFKLRGATNRLLQLSPDERERGVVAFSSGNHARGVAIAARRLGIRPIIVMPSDAPKVKVDGTRGEGAEIVFYDRRTESREAIAARICGETGATVVPSFDDPAIVAGQGTAGLEIVDQLGRPPQRIIIPCGGGGLASGIALAVPDAEIVIVEPQGWDDMAHSLELGEIVPVAAGRAGNILRCAPDAAGVADHLRDSPASAGRRLCRSPMPKRPRRCASPGSGTSLIVETGRRGRACGACWQARSRRATDTVVVLSGGNVDPALHARIVAAGLGDVACLIFAGIDMDGARALDRLGQLFELGGEGLELADEEAALAFGDGFGGVDKRFEHHCDARQDRLLDPLERLFEARLLLALGMAANLDRSWLSLGEIRSENGEFFVGCDGDRNGRRLPAGRRRSEAGRSTVRPAAAAS